MRGGPADAVRHAAASCAITRRFGSDVAEAMGEAHEEDSANSSNESRQDRANNAHGRELATRDGGCLGNSLSALRSGDLVSGISPAR